MKLHRYIGCACDIFFEEIDVRFLVHKNLIGRDTRDHLLFFVMTGHLPQGMQAGIEENVIRISPESKGHSCEIKDDKNYLWFAL